jgi:nucleotide-binding universal stress UspA family protein
MPDIQPQTRHTAASHTPATVVVGVDGSDGSITAVRWAASHARATGARLRLIHAARESVSATIALPVPVSFTGAAPPRGRRARPGKRVVALAVAEARMFAPNVEVSGGVQHGSAADVLVDASAGASLLVVGSRGLSRLSRSLTGSVGIQVTAQAHCPTAVIRGEGDPTDRSWWRWTGRRPQNRRCDSLSPRRPADIPASSPCTPGHHPSCRSGPDTPSPTRRSAPQPAPSWPGPLAGW